MQIILNIKANTSLRELNTWFEINKLSLYIFRVIFSIAKGVQHDGRLPFWKPASVFAHYGRIVFAIGEINILLLLLLAAHRLTYYAPIEKQLWFWLTGSTNFDSQYEDENY